MENVRDISNYKEANNKGEQNKRNHNINHQQAKTDPILNKHNALVIKNTLLYPKRNLKIVVYNLVQKTFI